MHCLPYLSRTMFTYFLCASFAMTWIACDNTTENNDAGPSEDSGVTDGGGGGHDGGMNDGGDTFDGIEHITCSQAPVPPSGESCQIEEGSSGRVLYGTVLTPTAVYSRGTVVINQDGAIECVGCSCSPPDTATTVDCGQNVISPGMINAHDHAGWMGDEPWVAAENDVDPQVRWEHRHDWRKGKRGNPKINTTGSANNEAKQLGELRFIMSGATAILGSGGGTGFMRNLDDTNDMSALGLSTVDYDTFPLGDSDGDQITSGCDYPDFASLPDNRFYAPHIAEGIDPEARNEYVCLSSTNNGGRDLVANTTAIIHGVGLLPSDIADMAASGSSLIWSPRSNVSLYGDTASVVLMDRVGINIALGTDWIPSGSMNIQRELACVDSLNQQNYGGYFTPMKLWRMATVNGAQALGVESQLGVLAVGRRADIAIFKKRGENPFADAVTAQPQDILAVFKDGTILYGDSNLVSSLSPAACDEIDVCGSMQRVCAQQEAGKSLASLQQSASGKQYPLFFCETPNSEPSCTPARALQGDVIDGSGLYTGIMSADDLDGDGIANTQDICPTIFNPIRPLDDGMQGDADQDQVGDICDPCPLDANTESCTVFNPNDRDADGIDNTIDNCPELSNSEQSDTDSDGKGDLCDLCPQSANPGNAGCLVSIYDIKNSSIPQGTNVRLEDMMVTAVGNNGFFMQLDPTSTNYQGLEHSCIAVFGTQTLPAVGDILSVSAGTVTVYFGQIELTNVTFDNSGTTTIPETILTLPQIQSAVIAGQNSGYEGCYVTVENALVTNPAPAGGPGDSAPDRFEFEINGGFRVDDYLFRIEPQPSLNELISSIRGPLVWRNQFLKLLPRNADDVIFASTTLSSFSPAEVSVRAGLGSVSAAPSALTVTLSRTSSSNTEITLQSNNTGIVTIPSTLSIPAGQRSGEVMITGIAAGTTQIQASLGGSNLSTTVNVVASDASFAVQSLEPTSMILAENQDSEVVVRFNNPAPLNKTIALSANNSNITFPTSLTIQPNASEVRFSITGTTAGLSTLTLDLDSTMTTIDVDVRALSGNVNLSQFVIRRTVSGGNAIELTLPEGTQVPIGGYLVIARNAEQAAFTNFWQSTWGDNVTYMIAPTNFIVINDTAKEFALLNPQGSTLDGPSIDSARNISYQRLVPVQTASDAASWSSTSDQAGNGPTPGAGQTMGSFVGCYISEISDADTADYEFIEIFCNSAL